MIQDIVKEGLEHGKEDMIKKINTQFETFCPSDDFEVPPLQITKE